MLWVAVWIWCSYKMFRTAFRDPSDWWLLIPYILDQREIPDQVDSASLKKMLWVHWLNSTIIRKLSYWHGWLMTHHFYCLVSDQASLKLYIINQDIKGVMETLIFLVGQAGGQVGLQMLKSSVNTTFIVVYVTVPKQELRLESKSLFLFTDPSEHQATDFIQNTRVKKDRYKWILTIFEHCITRYDLELFLWKDSTSANVVSVFFFKEVFFFFFISFRSPVQDPNPTKVKKQNCQKDINQVL